MTRLRSLAATIVLVGLVMFALLACSANDDEPSRITRTAQVRPTQMADGKLARAPSPLTVEEVMKQPRDSARQAFMLLWFYAQWGSAANIYDMYDPRIARRLGADAIAESYAQARPFVVATLPRIVGSLRTPRGVLVSVEILSAAEPPSRESFLFGRDDSRWRVRYDTFLGPQLAYYVQTLAQERIAPAAQEPSPRAVLAGTRAARRYRTLSIRS